MVVIGVDCCCWLLVVGCWLLVVGISIIDDGYVNSLFNV